MAPPHRIRIIILILSLILFSTALANAPSDNDIPTLAMRLRGPDLNVNDITIDLLCRLSWVHFDAVNFSGWAFNSGNLMSLCDSAGVYFCICPNEIMQYLKEWGNPTYRYWFRNSNSVISSDSCFARSSDDFESIVQYTNADSMYENINADYCISQIINNLAADTDDHPSLWFYEVYDEANSQQGSHVAEDTIPLPWDDYLPNVFTQDTLDNGNPTLAEVEPSGIFLIQKYYAENNGLNPVTFTMNFGLLHSIDTTEYTGLKKNKGWTTMATQAICVRAMMEAEYQYPPPDDDSLEANAPEFVMFDYYPFRYVDNEYESSTVMCDDDWLFLIDHFEEGIDSTVIPAHEYDVPVFFFPQTFGKAGGTGMWKADTLYYESYWHRKPAPQEFLMLCNLALLHQAKGIFPYNICSYTEPPNNPGIIMSSLLDRHNIPFDAPYEEWVYTGRWPDEDFEYVRPDSLPPWIDGYDPLYELEDPPTEADYPKYDEDYFEWLCEPYADLYNNIGGILADVKWIGPEMYDLWWCSDTLSDGADISYDGLTPGEFITPVSKVFEDNAQETCYLFYVDRFCISDDNPYEITFNPADLPNYADCTTRLLDHSRRFIMDGTYSPRDTLYTFLDTLDAGEGRLVELVDVSGGLPADVRITASDIRIIQESDTLVHLETTVGDAVNIYADFYNMGTASKSDVIVTLYDSTGSALLGSDTLDFDGLGYLLPSSCRTTDRSTASFTWTPDSTDIGVHRLTAAAATWIGESNSDDNSVDFVFLVNPRDYATEVRGDAWDMTEGGSNDWNTDDIEAVAENWNTSTGWTDSVSGMFEGVINYNSSTNWFIGDISLAVPQDSTINSDLYHMLSIGMVGNNLNQQGSEACEMRIGWKDSHNQLHGWYDLLGSNSIGNGWDQYSAIGPIDLNDIDSLNWGNDDASELWLRMQDEATLVDPPVPVDIRIGWIRLEESAP